MGLFEVNGLWMQAIGKTTIHSLWIGLLILGLLRMSLACIPERSSRLRYGLAVSALLLLFSSVIFTFLMLYDPLAPGGAFVSAPGIIPMESRRLSPLGSASPEMNASLIFLLFGYIYMTGVLFMVLRSLASMTYLRGLRSTGKKVAPQWQRRFEQIGNSLGIKQKVDFFESVRVKAPLLLGYLKPVVIVPAGMLSMLPVSQVEVILMHELYHLKRRDFLVNILQLVIEGLLFYHPVVWIISGFIRTEREHCCDDGVLTTAGNPVNYAKALIHIAEQQQFTRLAPGAVGSSKQQFKSRINRILNSNTMKTNMRDKVLALALLAGSLVIVLAMSGFIVGPRFMATGNEAPEKIQGTSLQQQPLIQDTIPQKIREAQMDKAEDIDWETLNEEMEEARLDALKDIEEIDWEALKKEMEDARLEVLKEIEEIDWDAMKMDVDDARLEVLREMEKIDWEALREDMEEVRMNALKEIESIDWEEVRAGTEQSLSEMKLELEEMKMEIENSLKEVDWDKIAADIKEELEKTRQSLDSIKQD